MLLSDQDIRALMKAGDVVIKPEPRLQAYQPASVDLCLGGGFEHRGKQMNLLAGDTVTLDPGDFVLAHTLESVKIPPSHSAMADGKSTFARLGLLVHATAGWIDPGFEGQITLEMKNLSHNRLALVVGEYICQLIFYRMSSPALRPYGHPELRSHYQGQRGATAAKR